VAIASAETEKTNKENDINAANELLTQLLGDLKSQQGLIDAAVKELEVLRPACVDTGMTFEERKEKRDAEIEALQGAFCQLWDETTMGKPCEAPNPNPPATIEFTHEGVSIGGETTAFEGNAQAGQ
jgi:hypothetical protein